MSDFERKIFEHLETLAEAARQFWVHVEPKTQEGFAAEEHFEVELVRAEDFISDHEDSELLRR